MIGSTLIIQFGTGTISVGAGKLADDQWNVVIRETLKVHNIGEKLVTADINTQHEIVLTFPDEKQMLTVMAAFTNKAYDEIKTKYDAAAIDRWEIEIG